VTGTPPGTEASPKYKTGVIWGVLAVLLVLGTVASATVVWAVLNAVSTHQYLLDGVLLVISAFGAIYVLLLMAGIFYRIDRLRGVPHRRIELFE
jgi:Na+-translocating ferredoxin:NAD+ oxidoreductase RnfA subunit